MRVLTFLFTVVLVGCLSKHPTPPVDEPEPVTWLWSSETYEHVGTVVASSPFPIGDSLVLMSAGRDIRMHNQETGEVYWETFVDSGTNIQTTIFATDGELIFATHAKDVRAWSIETGEQVWLTELYEDRGTFSHDEIVYQNGKLFIGGYHNTHCLNAKTGDIIWSNLIGDSTAVNDITFHDGNLYVATGGFKDQGVYILDAETGDSLHNYILNDGIGSVMMAPIIEENIMYVGTSWENPFSIEAWNINTKELLWHTDMPNYEFICDDGIIVDDLLILSLGPFAIGAWDKYTGEQVWIKYPTHNYNWSRIGYDGTWIYYQHGWRIQVIEPETGSIVYSRNGPEGESIYRTTVANGKIFVHSSRRNMCFTTYDPTQGE